MYCIITTMDRLTYCTHLYEMFMQTMKPTPTTLTFSNLSLSHVVEESRRYQAFQLLTEIYRICPDYYSNQSKVLPKT